MTSGNVNDNGRQENKFLRNVAGAVGTNHLGDDAGDEFQGQEKKESQRLDTRQADHAAANPVRSEPERLRSFSSRRRTSTSSDGFFVNLRDKLEPENRILFDRMQKRRSWCLHPDTPSLSEPAQRILDQLKKFRQDNLAERAPKKTPMTSMPSLQPIANGGQTLFLRYFADAVARPSPRNTDSVDRTQEVDEEEEIRRKRAQGYLTPREILNRIKRLGEEDDDESQQRGGKRGSRGRGVRQADDAAANAVRSVLGLPKFSSKDRSRRAFHRGNLGVQGIGKGNLRSVASFRSQHPVSTSSTGYFVNLRDQVASQNRTQKRCSWSLHPDAPSWNGPAQRILDQLKEFRENTLAERPPRKRPVTPMPLPPSVAKRIRLSGQFDENESRLRAASSCNTSSDLQHISPAFGRERDSVVGPAFVPGSCSGRSWTSGTKGNIDKFRPRRGKGSKIRSFSDAALEDKKKRADSKKEERRNVE